MRAAPCPAEAICESVRGRPSVFCRSLPMFARRTVLEEQKLEQTPTRLLSSIPILSLGPRSHKNHYSLGSTYLDVRASLLVTSTLKILPMKRRKLIMYNVESHFQAFKCSKRCRSKLASTAQSSTFRIKRCPRSCPSQ